MRNRYPGICYVCRAIIRKGEGHFERSKGSWRLQCAIHPLMKHLHIITATTTSEAEKLYTNGFEFVGFVRKTEGRIKGMVFERTA